MRSAVDVRELRPDDQQGIHAATLIMAALTEEWAAADPPPSVRSVAASLFASSSVGQVRSWLATVAGEPAGLAMVQFDTDDENLHLIELDECHVVPDRRRAGVGSALLAEVLRLAKADGRSSVVGWTWQDSGKAFAEALGLSVRQDDRCSRLLIADVDDAQQQRWIDDAPARAAGYRLVELPDQCPDELLEPYAVALAAMNDAPLDDIEWVPPTPDVALIRTREAKWAAEGIVPIRTIAVDAHGAGAGLSELFVDPDRPSVAWQGDTGVVAAHRGHRLGQWLKAQNLQVARSRHPEIAVVETWNAQTNPWMLAINVEMGFRPYVIAQAVQGDIDRALDRLAAVPDGPA